MNLRRNHSPAIAAAKAGFSTSAAYRFEKDPRLPTQKQAHRERRRADPFVDVWENDVLPMLKAARIAADRRVRGTMPSAPGTGLREAADA